MALQAQPAAGCGFTLGFKTLRDQIPDVVGGCLENEQFNPGNGNAEQRTSGGLLVWRKSDNWTAFTNGYLTWINGPFGLASRPNAGPLFSWEAGGVAAAAPSRAAAPSTPGGEQLASPASDGWATVVRIIDPARLQVQGRNGERFVVWQMGIIGPTQGQGDWFRKGTDELSRRLPPGSRVWLQSDGDVSQQDNTGVVRQILRDGDASQPLGAELLRAGTVWVFPTRYLHSLAELYADRQAEAVTSRAAPGPTPSSLGHLSSPEAPPRWLPR